MKDNSFEKFAVALSNILKRVFDYSASHKEQEQPFGACSVHPKHASVPPPTKDIQSELEQRAAKHFESTKAVGYYFRYSTPPLSPVLDCGGKPKPITADDYHLTLGLPTFDEQWERITIARSLIYCPLDQEQHGWSDWFELQMEGIRLAPLLHQTLKEWAIKYQIKVLLGLSGISAFESFVDNYATHDSTHPMSVKEQKMWKEKEIGWKARYPLAIDVINSSKTLKDLYANARKKAAATRNPTLKSLFWAFVEYVELKLIGETDLTEEEKRLLIFKLREVKKRDRVKEKYNAKRPAICISDIECAHFLYMLMREFLEATTKNQALGEAIIFIWLAQHAAFSGLHLTVEDILSTRISNIDHRNLTILIKNKEVNITGGLDEILVAWLSDLGRNKGALFPSLTYDILEDIIGKRSKKVYGIEGKLLPRDFLERVHTISWVRISLDLRRQIAKQEDLAKDSPYRIDSRKIKHQIKEAIRIKNLQAAS